VFEPRHLPRLEATRDPADLLDLGMLPGRDMDHAFDGRWDKRKDYAEPIDLGWIGEDAQGIWLYRHPEAVLADDPELWSIVARFWRTNDRDLSLGDMDRCSAFFVSSWQAMSAAAQREEVRRMKRKDPDDG